MKREPRGARGAIGLLVAAATLSAPGCDEPLPTGPEPAAPRLERSRAGPGALTVMTRNLYVGDDIESVLSAPSLFELAVLVTESFADVMETDFPERAEALADEIALARPHLVGLQEVSLYRRQSPGDLLIGNPTPAVVPVLDFLEILLGALEDRGLAYTEVSRIRNFDVEVPIFGAGGSLDDMRLTDFDVVLAREDVPTANPRSGNYLARVAFELSGVPVEIPRGWAAVEATVKERTYLFVTTHLEPAEPAPGVVAPGIQEAQAAELAALLAPEDLPVVLTGDFNSAADGSTTASYGRFVEAGYVDLWTVGRRRGTGHTCCQTPDLTDPASHLDERVDVIFYRDEATAADGPIHGSVHAELVGEEAEDRTPSGLWPSDHAGVVATLRAAPALGRR